MTESQDIIKNLTEEQIQHFRVAIFGSARTNPSDTYYKMTFELAKSLGQKNIDVITGGGPGIMQAGNEGQVAGSENNDSHSIGLTIKLPKESGNEFMDMRQHFDHFSGRLDTFMRLSNVVVVMPGGIGTCLELFYTWQLIQVGHICNIPIILIGEMWTDLLKWIEKDLKQKGKISPGDMDMVVHVKTEKEALEIIEATKKTYDRAGSDYCVNLKKYQ